MNKKKLIILILIITIFTIAMTLSPATASHTFKKGKYKVTVSDKTYKKIKNGQKTLKKKVDSKKKTRWVTKKVKSYETWIDSNGLIYKSKVWNTYQKYGYKGKFIKSVWKSYSDGDICWDYYKVKKTVKTNTYLYAEYVPYYNKVIVWLDTI